MAKVKEKTPSDISKKDIKPIEIELETDKFGEAEAKKIVQMVMTDNEAGRNQMKEWVAQKKLDLMHYYSAPPSKIESIEKENWQSDRNLSMGAATADIYQATLLATCFNTDTLYFKATEINDIDNKNMIEKFTKWGLSNEFNAQREVDDFIHNRITQGFSCFYIYWKVWYEWVDRRIPKKTKGGGFHYEIKTERVRFEKGLIENIADLDDVVIPEYGKSIQDLPFFIHVIHKMGDEILEDSEHGYFTDVDEEWLDKLKGACLEYKRQGLGKEKAEEIKMSDITDEDLRIFPVSLHQWYGKYKKNGKTEKYRFIVEPHTKTLLAGKPLRKITRTGKIPYVGGAFIRVPGKIRGRSLMTLIAPILNAFNNTYNQKADFQYATNIPFGFHKADEGYTQQTYKLKPGTSYPTVDNPNESVYFPNIQRSMAWAYQDIEMLMMVLEKLTGAAAYFLTTQSKSSTTATRDAIVEEKGETKFSLWVNRTIGDISEAITMWLNMYQDWAPPKLGDRVLGKNGRKMFKNLSIETLRGGYDANLSPDIIAGSRSLEKQTAMWMIDKLSQGAIWTAPQVNPRGNWNLWADAMKAMGKQDVERYLGPEPKIENEGGDDVDEEWIKFTQGEVVEVTPGENIMAHLTGHMKQKEEKYFELDPEYRQNFDDHIFKTIATFRQLIAQQQEAQIANALAMRMVADKEAGIREPNLK